MSVTGHHSIDGVRAYKHVSDNQKQQLSELIQAKTCNKENTPDIENEPVSSVKPSLPSVVPPVMQHSPVQQPIVPQHPVLNIQGSASVVINYQWIWNYLCIWAYLLVRLSFELNLTCWWCCHYCFSQKLWCCNRILAAHYTVSPSTNFLSLDTWYVLLDTWYVLLDTWYVLLDTWHVLLGTFKGNHS